MNRQALQLQAVHKRYTPQHSLNYSAGKSSCTEHTSRSILQAQCNGLLPIQDIQKSHELLLTISFCTLIHSVNCLEFVSMIHNLTSGYLNECYAEMHAQNVKTIWLQMMKRKLKALFLKHRYTV